jgi:uncharacterized membrane protein YciS (DUF1049 family)
MPFFLVGATTMRMIMYILLIVIVLLGISFAILNPDPVNFNYYVGRRTFPLSLLLVITFVIGCMLGLCVGFFLLIKLKIKNYRLHSQLKVAEKEIGNLRAIPLQDRH